MDMASDTSLEKREAKETARTERTWSGRYYTPNVDILESENELTVLADMPGVSAGDVDIRFENGELSIHGKVKPRQEEGTSYVLYEYGLGDFYRTFQISETIDAERITAECKDGVLTLHLPKVERVKPRKIAVKTG
jgi:HSP20 family protein